MADNDEKPDYLSMSDEDFMKANGPAPSDNAQGETPEPTVTDETDKTDNQAEDQSEASVSTEESGDKVAQADSEAGDQNEQSGDDNPPNDGGKSNDAKPDTDADKSADKDKGSPSTDAKAQEGGDKPADKTVDKTEPKVAETATLTPEAFMAEVMKPFKANGKEIKIDNPQDAIRLMQMGAGLGRKLQTLQPALKTLRLLEKHNLMDEAKLSYLIDLDQRNPEAIKKLIKESGIDPLDLNTDDPVTYRPAVRTVSDGEVAFSDALKELEAHPEGKATIKEINEHWDVTSKQVLFKSPEILSVIQTQKDTGIYAKVTAEIDRQKMLGIIPQSKPFLEAYKIAGDYLVAQGGLGDPSPQAKPAATSVAPQAKVIVDTKVATPASTVANDVKAKAAAATKSTSARKAASTINPLAMADDEFLKQMEGRL